MMLIFRAVMLIINNKIFTEVQAIYYEYREY